jgi:hypothetical protein
MLTQQQAIPAVSYQDLGATEFLIVDYEATILSAIDNALSKDVKIKTAIYRHLEDGFGIKKAQIPLRIEDFTEAIEQTFGIAAKLIEIKIIENLNEVFKAFSYKIKNKELFFVEYTNALFSYLESKASGLNQC